MTIFVPPKDTLEIWLVEVHNRSRRKRTLRIQSYFEWLCGQWYDAHREFSRTFLETEYNKAGHVIYARNRKWDVPYTKGSFEQFTWPFTAFHACSVTPAYVTGDSYDFIGRNGDPAAPAGVNAKNGIGSFGRHVDSAASIRAEITLKPGAKKTLVFVLGAARSKQAANRLVKKYARVTAARSALQHTKRHWQDLLDGFECTTPDNRVNILVNTWLKYQAVSARLYGKTGYYQNSGAFGFRDQLQDSQVWLPLDPRQAREHILRCCAEQQRNGRVCHWWFPGTPIKHITNCSDDYLWLPWFIVQYLKETADFSMLKRSVPFADGSQTDVLGHALASIDRALHRMSPRGIPLLGDNDWNDGLSNAGKEMKGESVWLAHFLHLVLTEWAAVLKRLGIKKSRASRYKTCAQSLRDAVNAHCWDGSWYWRATTDTGEKLGSHACREGKLFLNAQTWALIGGTAPPDRAEQAMAAARKYLYTPYGSLLFSPAFTKPDPGIGYLTQYAPGTRENGGVYTHAAVWSILAEALRGNGTGAWERFNALCPVKQPAAVENYACEPYVLPGNIDGPASPTPGRAGWTWYTGSAAWLFHALSSALLGIRAEYDGLVIDPCIPARWKTYTVKRHFRGACLHITVNNPDGVETGVASVSVNGVPAKMPLTVQKGKEYIIVVRMGCV
jgi:cellobiose phosphorylase